MGNCKSKDVIDAIDISRDIISRIVNIEKTDDEVRSLQTLLEMLYTIDKLDKHNQKLVLSLVENKISTFNKEK
jgi:hypothetical protein